ncbi:hypothetical protein CDD81_3993 [Ophiocordyceps australis]|uniref:Berberine/berberine-like domain-containing protein n=1 Tax=Ophiocordyceps australis TaxID=1399860 RepID=A0A2C5YCY6_9HYPO|nr:hypothetical protein CDD81_3993 [Ophiocordyceps australis]
MVGSGRDNPCGDGQVRREVVLGPWLSVDLVLAQVDPVVLALVLVGAKVGQDVAPRAGGAGPHFADEGLDLKEADEANPAGNVLGLEKNAHDGILMQASVSIRTSELEEWARPKVRAFAASIDVGVLPWIYLNYAHASQMVLQSYGPDNVRRMREAAAKYDADGVFQRLCPGGFKISAVKD